jgi:NhaP-type Na+/H+ or K+/H+ antiporter
MGEYILLMVIVGVAIFSMAWMPTLSRNTGISYAILYVAAGALLYTAIPATLPQPLPRAHETVTLHLAELVVIISLMGTGIKIDRPFSLKNWRTPLRLIAIAMTLCITGAAMLGVWYLGFNLATAILAAAALAPTDPVLASDVQVGPPNEKIRFETKFSLTAEAGMNDGMAFPFVWLSITLAASSLGEADLLQWLTVDLLYKVGSGLVAGFVMGKMVGFLIFRLAKRYSWMHTRDGFLAVGLTLLVYALTEMIHGYGFIAVFITAITLRHFEKEHNYHNELHSFTDQIERLLVAVILLLFGGALVSGILSSLTWRMAAFSLIFLLIIRPLAAYVSLLGLAISPAERLAISFLGIRGIGSIFYLAFALSVQPYAEEAQLWSLISLTILCSITLHGLTANPIMKYLEKRVGNEPIPDT